jgi:hypothetical protein
MPLKRLWTRRNFSARRPAGLGVPTRAFALSQPSLATRAAPLPATLPLISWALNSGRLQR